MQVAIITIYFLFTIWYDIRGIMEVRICRSVNLKMEIVKKIFGLLYADGL